MAEAPLNRQQLEDLWRQRVQDARLRLQFARTYVKEVQRDLEQGAVASADGHFAFQRAIRAEYIALSEYNRVLRVYTDLLVAGKIPDEEPGAAGDASSATL